MIPRSESPDNVVSLDTVGEDGSFNLGGLGLLRRTTEPLGGRAAPGLCALIGETVDMASLFFLQKYPIISTHIICSVVSCRVYSSRGIGKSRPLHHTSNCTSVRLALLLWSPAHVRSTHDHVTYISGTLQSAFLDRRSSIIALAIGVFEFGCEMAANDSTNGTMEDKVFCYPLLHIAQNDIDDVGTLLTSQSYTEKNITAALANASSNSSAYVFPEVRLDTTDTKSEQIHFYDSAALLVIMGLLSLIYGEKRGRCLWLQGTKG